MKSHPSSTSSFFRRSCSCSRDGVALVIVLAFIVLLTILIVSFIAFTRLNRASTASYSKAIQAQEIAQGGLQDILADLHSEIIAGSMVYNTNASGTAYTNSYATAYVPVANSTAVPARIGYPNSSYGTDSSTTLLSPSLIRVSRATGNPNAVGGDSFFTSIAASTGNYTNSISSVPGGTILNRASLASTTNAYNGGRYISAGRWNKSYLLATNSSTVPSPFTTAAPDWVYVTRTGSRVCTTTELAGLKPSSSLAANYGTITAGSNPPASPVVGRYAFVMYDEGALLDANVAGYTHQSTNLVSTPADPTTGITQAVNGKSYLADADLTQLPGLSGSQATVDNFVDWRNASATATGNSYLLALISYSKNGFLNFQAGDSPLLGRQDLINYFASIDSNINTTSATYSQALPYLGTFTRAVTWPSWKPLLDSSNILPGTGAGYSPPSTGGTAVVKYKTNAELSASANRNLANVRFPSASSSVNHYNDSGTATAYSVNPGDPLLEHRFSLARINWLTHTGPATGMTQAVKDCFGLEWGADEFGNPCWLYDVHATISTTPYQILTLSQVAAQGREPDFFELLKAAILSGSLGRDPGKASAQYNGVAAYAYDWEPTGPAGESFDTTSAIPDMQIMQIGANIIDQWDTDSYPTAIYFKTQTLSTAKPETGPVNMVYGIENLPYINRVFQGAWSPTATQGTMDAWFNVELWDPFQIPTVTTNRPSAFCARAYGNAQIVWSESYGWATPPTPSIPTITGSGTINYDTLPSGQSNAACIYFSDSNIPSSFANPSVLTTANGGTYTGGVVSTAAINIARNVASDGGRGSPFVQFLGIHAGSAPYKWITGGSATAPPAGVGGTTAWDFPGVYTSQINVQIDPNPVATFCLQYYDGTNWLPYSYLSRFYINPEETFNYPPDGTGNASTDPIYAGSWGGTSFRNPVAHVDPLTDRFSASYSDSSHGASWGSSGSYQSIVAPNQTWEWYQTDPAGVANPCEGGGGEYGAPRETSGFAYLQAGVDPITYAHWNRGMWFGNFAQNNAPVSYSGYYAYYADPDGVVRPGNDYRWNPGNSRGYVKADGMSQLKNGYSTSTGTGTSSTTTVSRRPLVLNRPFRSVAEMGYAYRDLPFKSLDFFSPYSADAALLDVFSLTDEPSMVAGQFNPSNSPAPVIAAVISGANKQELTSTDIISTEASSVATQIAKQLSPSTGSGPLTTRADLVTSLSNAIETGFGSTQATVSADQSDKTRLEAPIRALAGVTNTRTWNLMIDVIAQSGHMSPTAATLNDFVVEGEKRYWLHIAIDRYTGKIIDQQLEPVYE